MGTKACNIFFQEDVEDYFEDPTTLLDFGFSENCLRNVTIEDPGYIVNISSEDYEVRLQKSLSLLKGLKEPSASSGYSNKNLLSKCRTCSIKLVDFQKFPRYYRKKYEPKNKSQYLNTEHNFMDTKEEKNEDKIIIIDLLENDHDECNKRYDDTIREKEKEKIEQFNVDCKKFTSAYHLVGGQVRKQTHTRFLPVLNFQNQIHSEVPRSEAVQNHDLIFSTYTNTIEAAIQNCDNFLQDIKSFEKVETVPRDINNNECKKVHYKKKNSKKNNKIKNMYTSEQITKTKLKFKKCLSKEIISKEMEDKEYKLNLNAINKKQYDSLKIIEKRHNSYSYPLTSSPIFKTSASLPNRNIGPNRIWECNKQVFSGDRIIPHYHKNTC